MSIVEEDTNGNKIQDVNIDEIKPTYTCENCGKVYKSRGGIYKHKQKCIQEEEEEEQEEEEEEQSENEYEEETEYEYENGNEYEYENQNENENDRVLRYKLQNELKQIVMNNPSAINLDKPIFLNELEQINQMSLDELQARIIDAKMVFNRKLDMKVSDSALTLTNQVVGGLLGCVDELNEEVLKDDILREATKDLLSFKILNHIPIEMKVSGLYSLNVANAMKKARVKKQLEKQLQEE